MNGWIDGWKKGLADTWMRVKLSQINKPQQYKFFLLPLILTFT